MDGCQVSAEARKRREQSRAIAVAMSDPTSDTPEPEPQSTARCFGIWREEGRGWRYAVLELPRDVVERYAVEVSEPELYAITMGKVGRKLAESGGMGGR